MDELANKSSHDQFRHRRYGVYDLVYEDTTPPPYMSRIYSSLDGFRALCKEIPHVKRQLADTIELAPAEFAAFIVATIWRSIYPAINLYWLSVLFEMIGHERTLPIEVYWSVATSWIFCAILNIAARRIEAQSLEVLTRQFRAHFLPQLIRASLRVDLLSIEELRTTFPVKARFESEFPGGCFLNELSHLMERGLGFISQVFVLLRAISRKRDPERGALLSFCVVHGLVRWLAPPNGIGCSAYIYWPNNQHFQRMKTLFGFAFLTGCRADLLLDGVASSIESEYKRSAEQLGNVESLEPTPWRTDLWRAWYWDFLMEITLDLFMATYMLLFPACLSPSSMASLALLQRAIGSITASTGYYPEYVPTLLEVCSHPKRLYDAIDYQSTMSQGTEPFPRPVDNTYDAGMKISFKNVSLQYPGSDHHALRHASFDILPGELVLVVGTNGSGKSSMLKLFARLFDPTAGEILVDDLPLIHYDAEQLRAAIAFQSRSPVVYPTTVRENVALGLPPAFKVECEQLEEAVRMGSCFEWMSRLKDGYETKLKSTLDVNHGWLEGVYGYPSKALIEELDRHYGNPVSMSDGEKQRLASARTFMRINNRTTRLVILDEATASLDPVAESDILTAFRKVRAGKTTVIVTHRFHHLAHEADRILCMKDGRIVETGTHANLIRANGDYAALYHAQVEGAD